MLFSTYNTTLKEDKSKSQKKYYIHKQWVTFSHILVNNAFVKCLKP